MDDISSQYIKNVEKFKLLKQNSGNILQMIRDKETHNADITTRLAEAKEADRKKDEMINKLKDDAIKKDEEIKELKNNNETNKHILDALYKENKNIIGKYVLQKEIKEQLAYQLDNVEEGKEKLEQEIKDMSYKNEMILAKLENCTSRAGYVPQVEYNKLRRQLIEFTKKQAVIDNKIKKDYKINTENMNSRRLVFLNVVKEVTHITSSQVAINSLSDDQRNDILDRFNTTLSEYIETIVKQYAKHYIELYTYASDSKRAQFIKNEQELIFMKLINIIYLLMNVHDKVNMLSEYKKNNLSEIGSDVIDIADDNTLPDSYNIDLRLDELPSSVELEHDAANPFLHENITLNAETTHAEKYDERKHIQMADQSPKYDTNVNQTTSDGHRKITKNDIALIARRLRKINLFISADNIKNITKRADIINLVENTYSHCKGKTGTAKKCRTAVNTIIDNTINPTKKIGGINDTTDKIISGGCALLSSPILSWFLATCVLILLYLIYTNIYLPRQKRADQRHVEKIKAVKELQPILPDSLYYTGLLY